MLERFEQILKSFIEFWKYFAEKKINSQQEICFPNDNRHLVKTFFQHKLDYHLQK